MRGSCQDELFSKIDSGEVELTGDGGLVPALIKETLERGLAAEMTSHLGYAKDDREAKATKNSRNGSYAKTVASEAGEIEISVPRDR
ncbi:transposase, partial [Nesterenkonia sphaerica]|uniref:transposase n=1 Tax=Nesterenkonia sphaerica TaxID=1804988 RepID=UPI001FB7785A